MRDSNYICARCQVIKSKCGYGEGTVVLLVLHDIWYLVDTVTIFLMMIKFIYVWFIIIYFMYRSSM